MREKASPSSRGRRELATVFRFPRVAGRPEAQPPAQCETLLRTNGFALDMEPLDLRDTPPRSPRAELGGVVFLPRSIDKLRAALPGGQLGEFTIEGFTEMMLEKLELDLAKISAVVAAAASDADVAAWVTQNARAGAAAEWNAFVLHRQIFNGDRAAAIEEIPWLAGHPEIQLSLDLLEEDDRRSFAK